MIIEAPRRTRSLLASSARSDLSLSTVESAFLGLHATLTVAFLSLSPGFWIVRLWCLRFSKGKTRQLNVATAFHIPKINTVPML